MVTNFKPCTVQGCNRGARSKGRCKRHGGGKRCQVPSCNRSDQGGGKCISHGGGKRCEIPGCLNASQSKGLCKSHGGKRICTVPSCDKTSFRGGYCRSHRLQPENIKKKKLVKSSTLRLPLQSISNDIVAASNILSRIKKH